MAYRNALSSSKNERRKMELPTLTNVITVQPFLHVSVGMINILKTVQEYLV